MRDALQKAQPLIVVTQSQPVMGTRKRDALNAKVYPLQVYEIV